MAVERARSAWSMYDNLTCPYEWSKYSCVWRHLPTAEASHEFTHDHAVQIRAAASALASPLASRTVLWLVGDSLMRQIFIAIACAAGARAIARDTISWSKYWSCFGESRCISKGPHSGFDIGSVFWRSGFEMHFLPLGGTPHHSEPGIIHRFLEETRDRTLGTPLVGSADAPTNRRASRRGDVIVLNCGIHKPSTKGVLEGVAELQSLLPRDGPRLLYLTTPTQHFNTSEGQYEENARAIGCVSDVPVNPRAELERAILRPANVSLVEYDDLRLGRLHVGGRDCSHYCMPGKPDEVAARLVAAATGSDVPTKRGAARGSMDPPRVFI